LESLENERERLIQTQHERQYDVHNIRSEERKQFEQTLRETKEKHSDEMSQIKRRHDLALSRLQEQHRLDKAQWQSRTLSQLQAQLSSKETAIRALLKKEMEEEIEALVVKFGFEISNKEQEWQKTLSKIKEQHKRDLSLASSSSRHRESSLHAQLQEAHRHTAQAQHQAQELESRLAERELELSEERKRNKDLSGPFSLWISS